MTGPWPASAELIGGRLRRLGGCSVSELVSAHGSPLWILDRAELDGRLRALTSAMAAPRDVVYAAKALCVTAVLQLVARAGASVDVASAGELATALAAAVPAERIVLHGNNKSAEEIDAAVSVGVGRVVVDGMDEIELLDAACARRGTHVDCLLRLTPGVHATTHSYVATGHDASKFGVSVSAGLADQAVERLARAPRLRLRGFHSHLGSQIAALDELLESARVTVAAAADLARRHHVEVDEIDVGGGLGIAYTAADRVVAPADWATAVREVVSADARRRGLGPVRVLVEPGRGVVGPAGVTLYTVGGVKRTPGVRVHVAVDGGMSDNVRAPLYGATYTFANAGPAPSSPRHPVVEPVDVVGKHCESGDVLGRDVPLSAPPAPGELLAVAATGAYHHAMSSNYNRLPRPAMVLVADGHAQVVVRRETVADVLALDVPLEG